LVEIDEIAARVVRQYWALVLACVALPLVAIGLLTREQPPIYAANARIITGSVVPSGTAAADSIVSQVQGLATSRNAASQALSAAGVTRNLSNFISSHINVSGLGSSQVVDLTVTDRDPAVAEKAAKALASAVTVSLNSVGQSGLAQALKAIDDQVVLLSQQRAAEALKAAASPRNQLLQAKLAGLDEVIAGLAGDRGRLLTQASTQGRAEVIDTPTLPTRPQSKALVQKLGLAGLLGLVSGILLTALAETVRPTVPGARRVSKRLGTAMLGRLNLPDLSGELTPGLADLTLRLRLAARRSGVSAVALADVSTDRAFGGLVTALERSIPDKQVADGVAAGTNNRHASVGSPANATGLGGAGTLVKSHYPAAEKTALRIYPLGQMSTAAERDRVGLLVLVGPVTPVSDVASIADLAASSGWPLLGVVGVPRARRVRLTGRDSSAAARAAGGSAK
jgi:capsular polysaccharide biosynthesis protein